MILRRLVDLVRTWRRKPAADELGDETEFQERLAQLVDRARASAVGYDETTRRSTCAAWPIEAHQVVRLVRWNDELQREAA